MSNRSAPEIADHQTLRLIGRGAYGEVWLARSVTGALRAVKVVWREDYDHSDSFEREFEAIRRYEPISRNHNGLMPILQVGRNDAQGFYYYVMELADDLERGRDIDPESYVPHTLGLEMKRRKRITAQRCLSLGADIADGLHHLHQNQLIHRDVKPSNLVFLDGSCRLADLGLVALLGQRSFVGTEGFVAPEGPGSAASDIFSLGMVLYEASTGKDRLDFPDLPTSHSNSTDLLDWQRLHRIICMACAPKANDRHATAAAMAAELRGGKVPMPRSKKRGLLLFTLCLIALLALWLQRKAVTTDLTVQTNRPLLRLVTTPPGARVFAGEDDLGVTPLDLNPEEGMSIIYQVRLSGHKHVEQEHIALRQKPAEYHLKLEPTRLPQVGERWTNSLGMAFKPAPGGHLSVAPVEIRHFKHFLDATGRTFEGRVVRTGAAKEPSYAVVVPPGDSEAFRFWITERDRDSGLLSQEHHYEVEPFYFVETEASSGDQAEEGEPHPGPEPQAQWQAFQMRIERQSYGSVIIRSRPEKVKVYQFEELLGTTPLELPRVRSGGIEYELREEGFSDVILDGEVRSGEQLELFADMQARKAVTFGREWKANSLGIRFVPLTEGIMITAQEIRRRDYLEYTKATGARRPGNPDSEGRGATLPVVGIDRNEARAFCKWLTEHERNSGLIADGDTYRLPTDAEWSRAAGLPLERGETPAERNGRIRGIYPWGFDWPPPNHSENLCDSAAARRANLPGFIEGFQDRHVAIAPVNATGPNERGIQGLGGNVSEWVDTDYDAASPKKAALACARGGHWRSSDPDTLLASARQALPPETRQPTLGFRMVLERKRP